MDSTWQDIKARGVPLLVRLLRRLARPPAAPSKTMVSSKMDAFPDKGHIAPTSGRRSLQYT